MKCPLCHTSITQSEEIDIQYLSHLYRSSFNIDISNMIACKLYFSHCPKCDFRFFFSENGEIPTGDDDFYNALNKISWYYLSEKHEYDFAKQYINDEDRVLEVGCGKGTFAKYIPQAQYLGLEFSTDAKKMAEENGVNVQNISIQEYAKDHNSEADVVCSFQVLEHVSNPHSFIQAKIDACRGGGG